MKEHIKEVVEILKKDPNLFFEVTESGIQVGLSGSNLTVLLEVASLPNMCLIDWDSGSGHQQFSTQDTINFLSALRKDLLAYKSFGKG